MYPAGSDKDTEIDTQLPLLTLPPAAKTSNVNVTTVSNEARIATEPLPTGFLYGIALGVPLDLQ
jgi:hypothetical protein